MELRILPGNIANMIAAGEVVQRPASVVKELMENALDAGAGDIKVVITDAGRTLIQVIDDGSGMTPDDAVLCFERHATSKIATAEDLQHILTFGFRGEALASIAAVAEVTLRTRTREAELGVEVEFAASEHLATREVQTPSGCNFLVRNLFYNVPARRKFLKSDSVEFKHILEEFTRIALTRPEVAFSLSHNGKDIHVLRPAKSLKFRINDLLGKAVVGELVDISAETSICSIQGFAGRPETSKKTLGNQFLFVNGRYFRSPYLHKAVMKAYENLIPEGTTPSYFIFIETPPGEIDVNISPTKTEVKFAEDSLVFQTLFAAVKEALGYGAIASGLEFDNPEARDLPVIGRRFEEYTPSVIPSAGLDPAYDPFANMPSGPEIPGGAGWERKGAGPDRASVPDGGYAHMVDRKEDYGRLFDDRTVSVASVMPVHGKYLVSASRSGLMIVHVRRARERIFFDRFLKAQAAGGHCTQTALFPVQVQVGAANRTVFDENADLLASLGFDLAPFGTDTVVVNGVPEGYSTEPGKVDVMVHDILLILSENRSALPEMMAATMAERFAVLGASGSDPVTSPLEARRLFDALMASENPEFTSSGKRILSILTAAEMDKRF